MEVTIRQETEGDRSSVFTLIEEAFKDEEYSDHQEQFLVERLRVSDAFIPGLSLVAEIDGQVVGYVLLTRIIIKNNLLHYGSLALAPVAVLPQYQKKGIGGQLIHTAHEKAKALGFTSVVLLGHQGYYPRFGYQPADNYCIELPFDVPKENCMVVALEKDALNKVRGVVEYPKEFFG